MQIYLNSETRKRIEELANLHKASMSGLIKDLVDAAWLKDASIIMATQAAREQLEHQSEYRPSGI